MKRFGILWLLILSLLLNFPVIANAQLFDFMGKNKDAAEKKKSDAPTHPASAAAEQDAAAASPAPTPGQQALFSPDGKTPPPLTDLVSDAAPSGEYGVGIDDVLMISVLKPEELTNEVTVAPDGRISFPYIGSVEVRGRSIGQIQEEIQERLGNGYMKYPVVMVSLKESRSRKFFVYGEVVKPGSYPMEDNMTVLRAISTAGGFTRFGSSSRVKVLRPKRGATGYDTIKVDINAVMEGIPTEDIQLTQGDIVVISQGVF